jgi:Skp family chaperone for outer membrane proteins
MTIRRAQLVAVGVLLACPLVALAQVSKWTADTGVVNYSSSPPDNRKSQKLDEDKGRVSTIEAQDFSKTDAARKEQALKERVDRLEQDAQRSRQTATAQEVAAVEAQRQWRERCIADRRTDCDDPYAGGYDPGYYTPYGVRPGGRPLPQRPGPGQFRPTPDVAVGGGGVVGPYLKPPPSGVVVGPGTAGVGAGYGAAPPGGVVITPGPAGVGAQYRPVPEESQPHLGPVPRPVPRQ